MDECNQGDGGAVTTMPATQPDLPELLLFRCPGERPLRRVPKLERFQVDRFSGRVIVEAKHADAVAGEWIFSTASGQVVTRIPVRDVLAISPAPPPLGQSW